MIININKPKDWTSNDVVRKVKSLLNVRKVGHAGTLDPLATGVLVVLTDADTKKQAEIMSMEKEYKFTLAFPVDTATHDMEGPYLLAKELDGPITEERLRAVLPDYVGTFEQFVPVYSAVKLNGKPLYEYARTGRFDEIILPKRKVTVHSLDFTNYRTVSLPEFFEPYGGVPENLEDFVDTTITLADFTLVCSKGTYVRSLARDISGALGLGAVVTSLVRTRVGPYKLEDAKSLGTLESLRESFS